MPRHIARHVAITIDVIIICEGNRRANHNGSPFRSDVPTDRIDDEEGVILPDDQAARACGAIPAVIRGERGPAAEEYWLNERQAILISLTPARVLCAAVPRIAGAIGIDCRVRPALFPRIEAAISASI